MSKKFRLFASVAAPFVSLPLMMQPAAAMPSVPAFADGGKPGIADSGKPGIIKVQQQLVPPGAPEGEGEKQRPRRPEGGPEGGQQQGEKAPAAREQAPREQAPAQAERPREAAPAERPAAEAPAERPQRRQQQESAAPEQKPAGGEEQPRRQRQQAAEPQGEKPAAREQAAPEGGDRQPRRNAQENAAPERKPAESQAETPAPKPRENNRAASPEAVPEAPANRRNAEGQGEPPRNGTAQDKAQPPASREAAPAQPKPAPAAPAEAQTKPNEARPAENKPAQAATPAEPKPNQANQAEPQRQPAPADGQSPRRQTTEGQQPPAAPGAPPRGQAEGQPPARPGAPGEPQRNRAEQAQPPVVPGAPGAPAPGAPGAPAPGAQPPAAAAGAQPPAAQPPVATTPEQVQRAKELARDPSAAKSGEQLNLPVENGAAVLDSAKERPMAPPPGGPGQPPRRPPPAQAEGRPVAPPKSDADAQAGTQITRQQRDELRALTDQRGERLDARPQFERPRGWDAREIGRADNNDRNRDGARVIISIDNQNVVRHDDSRRFYDERGGRPPEYERLRDGQVREVIVRDDGTRVVTIRNRYGEIVQRTRVVRGGEEYVLYSAPELLDQRRGADYTWRDPGYDLPPMRLTVPLNRYIADTSSEPNRDYYEFLEQPPVERVERVYSLDEVRYSARIRDKVPRIDLDTITFATGSAEIPMNQASSLRRVADAIGKVLKKDPSETFLIEGHTDAVGSDDSNLILSDQRAESVARVLTDAFGIAPENLTTQGYGERYLKVRTEAANQENRRVTIRRITPLVKPVAAKR